MKKLLFALSLLLLTANLAFAQGTGNSFPTPNGQTTGGAAILVPTGPITNGQPVMGPPSQNNGLPVLCTNCSPSAPTGASTNPTNGTITTTNTFQSLLAQNSARKACHFQNQGTHVMYLSTQVSPTEAGSIQIAANGIFDCTQGNTVIIDAIQITGTSGDAFAGWWQ